MPLVLCDSCHRHVDAREERCPFCGADHEPLVAPTPSSAPRLNRAAMVLGVGLALGGPAFDRIFDCNPTPTPAPVYGGPPVAVYGGPPIMPDASPPAPMTDDAGVPQPSDGGRDASPKK